MNILVRTPNWIGDQILAYPFFHYLRSKHPSARIVSVCVPWVADLQFRNLIDDVVVLPRPAGSGLGAKIRSQEDAAAELRRYAEKHGSWDIGYSLPNSLSAAWLLFRAGVKRRVGYKVDGRGLLLNDGRHWDPTPNRHRAQAYVDLLQPDTRPERAVREFWGVPPENELDVAIPGELSALEADAAWPEAEALEPPRTPYWIMAPGATAESRKWPAEFFVRLAGEVYEKTGWVGLIVGGPSEVLLAIEIEEAVNQGGIKRVQDMTSQCSVPGLWKLFRGAKFTLCNESGLAHMAALCGSFTQIVCGAADPKRTRPLGPGRVQVAVNPVDCWPCERNSCMQPAGSKIQCLRGIRPSTIWEEIQRGLKLA